MEHQAETTAPLIVAAQTRQHPQRCLVPALGKQLPAPSSRGREYSLVVEGGLVLLVGQREAGLEEGLAEKFHQPGQLVRRCSAQMSFSHSPQGSGSARPSCSGAR